MSVATTGCLELSPLDLLALSVRAEILGRESQTTRPPHSPGAAIADPNPAPKAQSEGEVDRPAFLEFHSATVRSLSAFVQNSTRDPVVTEDIVQESFLRFLRVGAKTQPLPAARAYIFRTAANLLKDRYRRRDLEIPRQSDESDSSQHAVQTSHHDAAPEARALGREVRTLLRQLSSKDRDLLWLAHVEQMSHREIAQVVGLREVSIRPMLFRARRRFGKILESAGLTAESLSS